MAEPTTTIPRRSLREGARRRWAPSRAVWLRWPLWVAATAVVVVVMLPTVYLIMRAVGASDATLSLIVRTRTLKVLLQTVWLAGAVTLASAALSVPLAWLTVRTDLPLRSVWSVLTALPLVIPSYVGAYLLVSALGPRGMLQQWLEDWLGIQRLPSIYGFPGALLALTLLSYPYTLLSVRAMLQRMDPLLEEAARGLGDGPWQTFWRVTLPYLRPALVAGSLLVALYVLRDFGAVSLLRYDTFTRVIYVQYRSSFDRTAAAALSLVLVALALAILFIEMRTQRRAHYHRSAIGASRPLAVVRLGRWRWPALIFCAVIVGLALVLPAGVLLYWLARGLRMGEPLAPLWLATRNSATAGTLAAVVSLLAALPIVILRVRFPSRLSRLYDRLTYVHFAVPGIAVALSLVFFGIRYARPLYQTLPLLVVAYVILFLPQAVGAVKSSLLQVHPSLEEAARSLGRSPLAVWRSITLPLVLPGVLSGAGLVFLTTMKELPATLILGPFGFRTLATAVWSAVSEAYFAQAAAPALLLILVSSVPMAWLTLRAQKDVA